MIQDRVLRILVIVGLVLLNTVLVLTLLFWLVMGVGMAGGMGGDGMMDGTVPMGLRVGSGVLALLVVVGLVGVLVWALRPPGTGGQAIRGGSA